MAALALVWTELAQAKMCTLPYFGGKTGPAAASATCKSSKECCGDLVCEGSVCLPKAKMAAAEAAYVAHLVIADAMNDAVNLAVNLDKASEAIADASDKVKAAAKKAAVQVGKASDAANAKVKELKGKAEAKMTEVQKKIAAEKDKKATAAKKSIDDLHKKSKDVIESTTAKWVSFKADEAASKGGDKTGSSGGAAAGGGFDKYYKKYMAGAGGSPGGSSSSKGSDAKGGAAAGGGAPDWKKFVPGSDTAGSKKPGASDDKKGGATAPGGMDWAKFVPKLVSFAAGSSGGGGSPGGFDWHKFFPGAGKTSNAAAAAPASDSGPPPEQKPGAEGSPCGKTPYKDFGKCKKSSLTCETHPLFTAFAPGKCVKKKDTSNRRRLRQLADADASKLKMPKSTTPGTLGGPCGKWELGKMDFGACKDDLTCTAQDQISLKYFGATYGFPNMCSNKTGPSSMSSGAMGASADYTTGPAGKYVGGKKMSMAAAAPGSQYVAGSTGYAKSGFGAKDYEKGPAKMPKGVKGFDPKKLSMAVADKASDAALDAADQAELLAHKLLAAAAQVREAAAQLKKEANGTDDSGDVAAAPDADSTAMFEGGPMLQVSSHFWLTSLALAALGSAGVLYHKMKRSSNPYRRI
ncbi:Uncharacterized protein SCF082_LOCUS25587 [Durusdinium trenchii]|uniref:Uncharacterized protein n=1 Tax=Durusdinium trenchii TaxID=1381693 RepID=A0ABP0M173_9DINO